jgi:alpha-glucosidase
MQKAKHIARAIRRAGLGRSDPNAAKVGDRLFRHRDPAFLDRTLRPSPALIAQPAPAGPATDALVRPTFLESRGWYAMRIALAPGTDLYGMGEAARPLRRNGQTLALWTTDAFGYDDRTEAIYQAHPWVLAVRADGSAFGVLADSPRRGVISADGDLLMAFQAEPFAVYVVERDSPQDVVRALAELTGKPPLPPLWSLGYHQCRWSYEPEARVRELAAEFRRRRVPCDVIWLDIDYMDGFRVFTFSRAGFPDPDALNHDLHAQGFKTVWMIDPGVKVDPEDPTYRSGREGGHFVTDASGDEFHGKVWPGACAFPDFTRERTRRWWAKLYRDYFARGVDGVWNDMNEPAVFDGPGKTMPASNRHEADAELGGPDDHARYHNIYGMQMVRATREGVLAACPDRRPFVLTRSNFLGGHRDAATWTGDNTSDWRHLRWSIPMAVNLGLSGQPFVGPDIGGFIGDATGHLFARWMGIGALLPFARGHSIKGSADHEPWSFGERCERICRLALERRYRLLPYFYTLFREASVTGMPVARPLLFADPADARLRGADDAFMLGDDVLVRARVHAGGICQAPLPRGRWAAFEPAHESDPELPELLVREGAIVPLGPPMQHVGERPLDPLTLVVHPDVAGRASGLLYEDEGDGFGFTRSEFRLTRIDAAVRGDDVEITQGVVEGAWAAPTRRVHTVVVRPTRSPRSGTA